MGLPTCQYDQAADNGDRWPDWVESHSKRGRRCGILCDHMRQMMSCEHDMNGEGG